MLPSFWSLLRQTVSEWAEDGAPRLGAALAYYSVFSLGPLLLIIIGIAGVMFGADAVKEQVVSELSKLIGPEGARAVQALLANVAIGNRSFAGTVTGFALLVFGALAVVAQLKDALNIIWDVHHVQRGGILGYVRTYTLSMAAVLGLGFLLAISFMATTAISAAGSYFSGEHRNWVLAALNVVADLGVLTLLFAMIFKWLPDTKVDWGDVWVGAAMTTFLFIVGKYLISLYLGHMGLESTFGAASSYVLILVWIYYSAQILFFGAEFTQVYARRRGSRMSGAPAVSESEALAGAPARNKMH